MDGSLARLQVRIYDYAVSSSVRAKIAKGKCLNVESTTTATTTTVTTNTRLDAMHTRLEQLEKLLGSGGDNVAAEIEAVRDTLKLTVDELDTTKERVEAAETKLAGNK